MAPGTPVIITMTTVMAVMPPACSHKATAMGVVTDFWHAKPLLADPGQTDGIKRRVMSMEVSAPIPVPQKNGSQFFFSTSRCR